MGAFSSQTAVAMGANIIEKHFCLGREIENPDSSFSMTPEEFREMVQEVRKTEAAMGQISYGVMKQEETNAVFRRSVFVVKDVNAGDTFTKENIRCIRPGYGCKPKYYDEILGKTADRDVEFGTPFTFDLIKEDCRLKHLEEKPNCVLREAVKEDLERYFEWANDAAVRANSFTTKPITLEEHTKWFLSKIEDDKTALYVMEADGIPVGQIRLALEQDKAVISYSIAAQYRGMGYAGEMLALVEEKVSEYYPEIKELVAEVKTENEASCKQFEKLGYEKESVVTFRKKKGV